MISKLPKYVFFVGFSIILLVEGLGINNGHQLSLYLIYTFPLFLFLTDIMAYRAIVFPKRLTVLFSMFFGLSAIFLIFSFNLQKSFESLLYFFALYLIFIFYYNHQKELNKELLFFTFTMSLIFLALN